VVTDADAGNGDFRGRDLQGVDFSDQDLRGADFTGADLRSASFRDARFGVPTGAGVVVLAAGLLASLLAGLVIGWSVSALRDRVSAERWDEVAEGGSVAFLLVLLVGLIIWRGFDLAMRVTAIVYLVVVAVNVIANLLWDEVEWLALARATAVVVFLALAVLAGILGRVSGGVFGSWSIAIVALAGGLASGRARGGVAGLVVAVSLVIISKRALRGDERDRTLRQLVHRLVRRWGTRFVDTDLTGADFTGTDAGRCDVRGATVIDVQWGSGGPLSFDLPDDAGSA